VVSSYTGGELHSLIGNLALTKYIVIVKKFVMVSLFLMIFILLGVCGITVCKFSHGGWSWRAGMKLIVLMLLA